MSLSASLAYFHHSNKYATEAERRLKLFPAVSLFCFSFMSKCDDRRADMCSFYPTVAVAPPGAVGPDINQP